MQPSSLSGLLSDGRLEHAARQNSERRPAHKTVRKQGDRLRNAQTTTMKRSKITLFTFGYWGWGNHTEELLATIDERERKAGCSPPVFVDIRFNRAVRAKGFNGDNFKEIVGEKRYRHMRSLGNARIGSGKGGIRINEPQAAAELLDEALQAADDNRRIIYFCACEVPVCCHRRTVAGLVEKEGEKRKLTVTNLEWPGGDPEFHELSVSRELFTKAAQIRATVPLPKGATQLRALPWYSAVKFHSKEDNSREPILIFTGPARFTKEGWCLPVFEEVNGCSRREVMAQARRYRKRYGYEAS